MLSYFFPLRNIFHCTDKVSENKFTGMSRIKNVGSLIKNGIMLSVVSLILRGANVLFGAYVSENIGAAGMGLYSLVGSVFAPAAALSSAGISLAVSRLVAEADGKTSKHVLRCCIAYALTVSLAVAAILVSVSGHIFDDPAAGNLLTTLALSLPFSALSSAFAGYFIGVRRVSRNAASALFEQIFRMGVTVLTIRALAERSPSACLAAVVISSALTDAASCLLSALLCRRDMRKHTVPQCRPAGLARRVLGITVPVSASSFLRSGLVAVEHVLVPKGMIKNGASYDAAMASYGTLSGMAMPIIMFPASFLYSFTGLLIPEFAEANGRGDRASVRSTACAAIRAVIIFSVGASGLILGFSRDIGLSVYGSAEAGKYIAVMAPLIPVMYLDTTVDSVLKGIGEQVWTMKVNILDAAISVLAVWLLVPRLGLYGYICVIFISEVVNFGFSLMRLVKVTEIKAHLAETAFVPLVSVSLSVLAVKAICGLMSLSPTVTAVFGITASAGIYFLLLVVLGVIPKNKITGLVGKTRKSADQEQEEARQC